MKRLICILLLACCISPGQRVPPILVQGAGVSHSACRDEGVDESVLTTGQVSYESIDRLSVELVGVVIDGASFNAAMQVSLW